MEIRKKQIITQYLGYVVGGRGDEEVQANKELP